MLARLCVLIGVLTLIVGCGDPPLHPITGSVTLDGKAYERLLVYFHPLDRKPDQFSIGVGETDKDGNLILRTTAGPGLATGKYRVTFCCYQQQGGRKQTLALHQEKVEDERVIVKDIVPEPYGSKSNSPVEFEVKTGSENVFAFDIPKK